MKYGQFLTLLAFGVTLYTGSALPSLAQAGLLLQGAVPTVPIEIVEVERKELMLPLSDQPAEPENSSEAASETTGDTAEEVTSGVESSEPPEPAERVTEEVRLAVLTVLSRTIGETSLALVERGRPVTTSDNPLAATNVADLTTAARYRLLTYVEPELTRQPVLIGDWKVAVQLTLLALASEGNTDAEGTVIASAWRRPSAG